MKKVMVLVGMLGLIFAPIYPVESQQPTKLRDRLSQPDWRANGER